MKTILYLTIALLLISCGSKTGFTYTTRANNIFYPAVKNPLLINSKGKPITVNIQNGTITETDKNVYWITPEPNKSLVTVTLTQDNKKEDILFWVYDLPSPELIFNGKVYKDRTIPLSEFKHYQKITAFFLSFTYAVEIELQSYKIIKITPEGKATQYIARDNYLPGGLTAEAAPGDRIVFYDLEFKVIANGYIFKGQDCVYTLK